jgi:protein-arginine deiminase
LTVVNVEGEPIHLFIPDPFMRGNGDPQSADPVIAAVQALLPGYELHFVDDWYAYHSMMGEVHCGTNFTRTPTADWWAESMHLLGGQ